MESLPLPDPIAHRPNRRNAWHAWAVGCALLFWIGLIGTGMTAMASYAANPGDAGCAPALWPFGTSLNRAVESPTLLMFAHPRCPCTSASLASLRNILSQHPVAAATVVFYVPAGADADWTDTDLWRRARAIPGVRVVADEDGREAARFGVRTSGDVLVFDRAGGLAFHGGLTPGRGEAGDGAGRRTVEAAIRGSSVAPSTAPVFGCPIFGKSACAGCPREARP